MQPGDVARSPTRARYMSSRPNPISVPSPVYHAAPISYMGLSPGALSPGSMLLNSPMHCPSTMHMSPVLPQRHCLASSDPTSGFFMGYTPPAVPSSNKAPAPFDFVNLPPTMRSSSPQLVPPPRLPGNFSPMFLTGSPVLSLPPSPQFKQQPASRLRPAPSLRKQVLMRVHERQPNSHAQQHVNDSGSSGDEADDVASPVKASKKTLPDDGDLTRIDHRHQHHYASLTMTGLYGESVPLNRIRVWTDGKGGEPLYDCVCGKRAPNPSLHKVKRHAYRHAVSSYTCDLCGKIFKAHWSLNAHKRIHKAPET